MTTDRDSKIILSDWVTFFFNAEQMMVSESIGQFMTYSIYSDMLKSSQLTPLMCLVDTNPQPGTDTWQVTSIC